MKMQIFAAAAITALAIPLTLSSTAQCQTLLVENDQVKAESQNEDKPADPTTKDTTATTDRNDLDPNPVIAKPGPTPKQSAPR